MKPPRDNTEAEPRPPNPNRVQTGVRTLLVLVASCGVMLWAVRYLWESQHPAIAVARRLQARNAAERLKAIRDLESISLDDCTEGIPPLITLLGDSAAGVRAAAASALGSLGGNAVKTGAGTNEVSVAVTALLVSLNDQVAAVRTAAANSLGMIARCAATRSINLESVAPALVRLLDDRDAEVRRAAIEVLGFVSPAVWVDPPSAVVSAMEDESAKIRAEAVYSLVGFTRGLPHVLPALLASMQRARPEVRVSYVQLIEQIQPPKFSAEAVPPLIITLASDEREIRHLAACRLAAFKQDGREAVPALIMTLQEP